MIDPKTVLVGIPCHDGRMMTELAGMLIQNRDLFGAYTMPTECSHPAIARNTIADTFERSPFEWLLGIDSDIVPQRSDFLLMLEESDPDATYAEDIESGETTAEARTVDEWGKAFPRRPTRVEVPLRGGNSWDQALQAATLTSSRGLADALVCSEYAYRWDPYRVVKLGGGFYRVHRSVFSVLKQLVHEDDGRVEVDREALKHFIDLASCDPNGDDFEGALKRLKASQTSQAGTPRLWQCTFQGRTFYDYYPSGPLLNLLVPIGDWKGEDHGFWTLCMLAGLIPRIETRTRVLHIGRKAYAYQGPADSLDETRRFGQPHFGHDTKS